MARDTRAKAEAAQRRADRLKKEFKERSERAFALSGRFAGGQPLLPGHHSYRSAVRDKRRADAASDRAVEAYKESVAADREAKSLKVRADAEGKVASYTSARERAWQPTDFQRGDIVRVRTFRTGVNLYRVKRVNKKTLTLDGGGGGMDDPKREYDRVLSRTRDGVTVTNPAELDS